MPLPGYRPALDSVVQGYLNVFLEVLCEGVRGPTVSGECERVLAQVSIVQAFR